MTNKFIIAFLSIAWLLSATFSFPEEAPTETHESAPTVILGRVEHLSFEGGFYGIVADDGTQYKPINLPESYQVENLYVKVLVRPLDKKLLTSGWGTPVEILDIERVR